VRPSKQCIVCDTKLKEKDIIELQREGTDILVRCFPRGLTNVAGTGFAGGGLAETSKAGIAFQG
jgi:nitric oxide synthase-interacting protein